MTTLHAAALAAIIAKRLSKPPPKGDQGAPGVEGQKGDVGPQGERGPRGAEGAIGDPGRDGSDGDPGRDGRDGERGPAGEQGLRGARGERGEKGQQGERGDKGLKGDRGAKGDKGEPGIVWRGVYSQSLTYEIGDAVEYRGSSWRAKQRASMPPTMGSDFWDLIAQRGQDALGVMNPPAVGGGGGSWGEIGGTLSDQGDLQAALNAKSPVGHNHDAAYDSIGAAAAAVAAHVAAGDPHPQYTTAAEASSAAPVQSVAAKTGAVTLVKGDVGLGSVDNTSDVGKPVSTAQQTALNLKQDTSAKDQASGYAGLSAGSKLAGTQQTYGAAANTACEGNDGRLSDSRAPTAAAGGDLGGTYPSPTVTQARGLRETAGPTTLALGAVADGQYLMRSGATVIGGTPAGAGALALSQLAPSTDQTITAGYSCYVVDNYEIAAGTFLEPAAGAVMEIG